MTANCFYILKRRKVVRTQGECKYIPVRHRRTKRSTQPVGTVRYLAPIVPLYNTYANYVCLQSHVKYLPHLFLHLKKNAKGAVAAATV